MQKQISETQIRRPSRFEVIPAPDVLQLRETTNNETSSPQTEKTKENSNLPTQPKKSILKKTNSFNLKGFTPISDSPVMTPYSTITGTESRLVFDLNLTFINAANTLRFCE